MTYSLEVSENVTAGIRRVLLERANEILEDLTNPEKDQNERVHNTRKNCKRIRAVLHLIRGEIGEVIFQQENIRFRDAARLIASARDSWVMIETLDKLVAEYDELFVPDVFYRMRQTLLKHYENANQIQSNQVTIQVVEMIRTAQPHLETLSICHEGFSTFQEGLQKMYYRGQKAMARAYIQLSPESFHEWRKRVKYLWHQIEILAASQPEILDRLAEELHTLSEYLGHDHDLAVLRCTIFEEAGDFKNEKGMVLLVALVDQKRLHLQADAQLLGERLYFDSPQAFTRRIKGYWKSRMNAQARFK